MAAFNQNTTPELIGKVDHVAADQSLNPQTGEGHYGASKAGLNQLTRRMVLISAALLP